MSFLKNHPQTRFLAHTLARGQNRLSLTIIDDISRDARARGIHVTTEQIMKAGWELSREISRDSYMSKVLTL